MFAVDIFVGVPLACQERVLRANDLAIEERSQRRVFLRKTSDLEVAAQVGIGGVNMLRQKQFAYLK